MPQNIESNSISETQTATYRKRLNGWAIARSVPDMEREIVARFRSRSDADGYLRHLRQEIPNTCFEVIFDCQREEIVI